MQCHRRFLEAIVLLSLVIMTSCMTKSHCDGAVADSDLAMQLLSKITGLRKPGLAPSPSQRINERKLIRQHHRNDVWLGKASFGEWGGGGGDCLVSQYNLREFIQLPPPFFFLSFLFLMHLHSDKQRLVNGSRFQ